MQTRRHTTNTITIFFPFHSIFGNSIFSDNVHLIYFIITSAYDVQRLRSMLCSLIENIAKESNCIELRYIASDSLKIANASQSTAIT